MATERPPLGDGLGTGLGAGLINLDESFIGGNGQHPAIADIPRALGLNDLIQAAALGNGALGRKYILQQAGVVIPFFNLRIGGPRLHGGIHGRHLSGLSGKKQRRPSKMLVDDKPNHRDEKPAAK